MDRSYRLRPWHLAALVTAAVAVCAAAARVHHDRMTRARRLGVSVLALSNPDRFMKKLRRMGGV